MTTTNAALTAPAAVHPRKVCVTGSNGYIGSWIVKLLLDRGYTVHGTVRNLDEWKNKHLKEMEGASDRLVLYKADMLDFESLRSAIDGCEGVFHTACPITNDPELVLQSAVEGTRNVIRAAAEAAVRRVVFTSSIGAVTMDPNRGDDVVVDESCWSDLEFCMKTKNWYCYGKVLAEQAAWELARSFGVDLVVVIPVMVVGPFLQSTVNTSTTHVLKYINGSKKTYPNAVQAYVHVHDVADAHIRIYEAPAAAGRYMCAESVLHREDYVRMLAQLFPDYPILAKCIDEVNPKKKAYKFSNQKLKELGMNFIPVAQALYETVKSLQEKGQMPTVTGSHARLLPLRSHL